LDEPNDRILVSDYVADIIEVYSMSTGSFLTSFGGPGSGDGQMNSPRGLTFDSNRNILVSGLFDLD